MINIKLVFRSPAFVLLFIVSLFTPPIFAMMDSMKVIHYFFLILRGGYLIFVCFVYLYCIVHRTIRLSLFTGTIFIMYGFILLSTIINQSDISGVLKQIVNVFLITLYIELAVRFHALDTFVMVGYGCFCAYVIIDFMLVLLYPDGLYFMINLHPRWFLGQKNAHVSFFILAILFGVVYSYYVKQRFTTMTIIILALFVFSVFYRETSTGIICVCFILALLLLKSIFNIEVPMLFNTIFNLGLFAAMCIFRLQDYFSFIIEGILKKELNFTYRTMIWDEILLEISQTPLLGTGFHEWDLEQFYVQENKSVLPHSSYLAILQWGGLITFVVFIFLLLIASKSYDRHHTHATGAISILAGAYLLHMQMEGYAGIYLILIMAFLYHIQSIESQLQSVNRNKKRRLRIIFTGQRNDPTGWYRSREKKRSKF